jgi:UDP-glucose 6-dehydrogenase
MQMLKVSHVREGKGEFNSLIVHLSFIEIEDYNHLNTVLVFNSDTSRVCSNIPVIDDSVVEMTEMFGVMLTSSEPDVDLQDSSAVVDIIDNDRVVIGFEMEQYQGEEGGMVEVCAVLTNGTLERSLIIEIFTGDISAQGLRL